MSKYTLLRNNRQCGPYTLDEIANMGLKTHDLIWVDGKSASWRYPTEIEELKSLVPKPAEKSYNHIPFSRTRLKNDFLLLGNDSRHSGTQTPLLSETEVAEFPTLARFFMAEYYEKQPATTSPVAQPVRNNETVAGVKKSVWVSMPSTVKGKNIVLINSREASVRKELRPILPPEDSCPAPEILSEELEFVSEVVQEEEKSSVIPLFEDTIQQQPITENIPEEEITEPAFHTAQTELESALPVQGKTSATPLFDETLQQQPITENISAGQIPEPALNTEQKKQADVESVQPVHPVAPVYFMRRKDKRRYASSVLQNLAVAVAIASLLTVGGLIAYSILYPDYPTIPASVKTNKTSGKMAGVNKNISSKVTATEAVYRTQSDQGPPGDIDQNKTTSAINTPDASLNGLPEKSKKPVEKKAVKRAEEIAVKDPDNTSVSGEEQLTAVVRPVEQVKTEEKKNIAEFVDLRLDGYKVGLLGGVKEFDVVIRNNADVPLDLVVVELKYIQSNKKVYKTETLQFYDIAAQSHQSIEVPRSSRGVKVETHIKSIASREYGLGFNN